MKMSDIDEIPEFKGALLEIIDYLDCSYQSRKSLGFPIKRTELSQDRSNEDLGTKLQESENRGLKRE